METQHAPDGKNVDGVPNTAPQFDTDKARTFLAALVPGELSGSFLEIRLLHPHKAAEQGYVTKLSAIPWERVAYANKQGWSITIGPGLRKRKSGKKEDVGALTALWADLDAKNFSGGKVAARAALSALPEALQPSGIIDSGHGIHPWWFFDEPLVVTDDNRAQLENALRWLHRQIGSDAVHDLGRVMRLPGSINVKDPAAPVPCHILELSAERRFRLEDFTAHMAKDDRIAPSSKAQPIEFAATVPKLGVNELRVSARIKKLVKTGWLDDGRYKSRSETDLAVVTAMRKAGHNPDEIKAAFVRPGWGIGAKYRELIGQRGSAEADRHLIRCITSADELLLDKQAQTGPSLLFVPNASPPDIAKVKAVVEEAFPELWTAVVAVLATVAAMVPDDVVNPPTLILEGASAAGKTTVIDMVEGTPYLAYRTDKFTPSAFVTHSANVRVEKLAEIDLLPRIRHRCMLTAELAPLFRGREDELTKNFSILTRVLDGGGLMTDSGSQGRRGYEGDYLFSWIGATTPLESRTWRIMQQLGARLLFYWVDAAVPDAADIVGNLVAPQSYKAKVAACRTVVNEFLLALFRAHARRGTERPFGVAWNRAGDPELIKHIARLAKVAAQARAVVSSWQNDGGELNFRPPSVEQPHRLATLLYNLARGHALVYGRTQLSSDDLWIVTRVALDSMPIERRRMFRLLISIGPTGIRSSAQVEKLLRCSRPVAIRLMKEMAFVGVARVTEDATEKEEGDQPTLLIGLRKELHWLANSQTRVALGMRRLPTAKAKG